VRVADRGGAAGLGGEAIAERRLGLCPEDLDRDVSIESQVTGAPDLGGAPAVDALGQAVPTGDEAGF